MPVLLWGHAGLSGLILGAYFLPERIRPQVVRAICAIGAGLGVALFLERRSGDTWRTTLLEPDTAALAGIATATAWVVAAVILDELDRWRAAALVGVAGTALGFVGATQWIVPALLFWSLTSIAAAALAWGTTRRGEIWIGIVISDLCFAAGMIGHIVDSDSWRLPQPLPDRAFWFVLAAVIIRAGVVPRFGPWRALGTPAAPALPLLVGGAFVIAAGPLDRAEPWAAVALLLVALAQASWGALSSRLAPADFAGWPSSVGLALVFIAPSVAPLVGAAALLGVGALALWPIASGRAQPERGLLLTFAPLTAGFGAVVFAARRAFEVATTLDASLESAPWIAATALLPFVLAAGALLGARVGRERRTSSWEPWPVGATWVFVAATVALGLTPGSLELPDDVVGISSSFVSLLAIAIGLGVLSGWLWNLRHPSHRRAPSPEPAVEPVGPRFGSESVAYRRAGISLVERMLMLVALALALATMAAIGWITYEGLSQGFL